MEKHVTILAILWLVLSAFSLLGGVVVLLVLTGGGALSGRQDVAELAAGLGAVIGVYLIITAVAGIVGGIGLLKFKPWARILVLVLGFLSLISIPFGTILGIYSIWVLMKDETDSLFKRQVSGMVTATPN